MKSLAVLLLIALLTIACDSNSTVTPTSPSTTTSRSQQWPYNQRALGPIAVGQGVVHTLYGHGAVDTFEFTAPTSGTLVVRLSWNPADGYLELWLDDKGTTTDAPPLSARWTVLAGQTYRISVGDRAAWDYDEFRLQYVLTVAVE